MHYTLLRGPFTGEVKILLAVGTKVDGEKILFLEDLDIDSNGIVYIAEGSTKWTVAQVSYLLLEAGSHGRSVTVSQACIYKIR